jgi:hypothetical protein
MMSNRILIFLVFLAGADSIVHAQAYVTKDEALALYLGKHYDRKTVFLTDDQVQQIQQKAKAKVESKIVTYYRGNNRFAYFETRTIRTMPATFIVVLDTSGSIHGVEMLAFYEPEDYQPPKRWLKTFESKTINDDLWLKRGVYNISGATLSAQAITESIRKILATHSIVIRKEHQ